MELNTTWSVGCRIRTELYWRNFISWKRSPRIISCQFQSLYSVRFQQNPQDVQVYVPTAANDDKLELSLAVKFTYKVVMDEFNVKLGRKGKAGEKYIEVHNIGERKERVIKWQQWLRQISC